MASNNITKSVDDSPSSAANKIVTNDTVDDDDDQQTHFPPELWKSVMECKTFKLCPIL